MTKGGLLRGVMGTMLLIAMSGCRDRSAADTVTSEPPTIVTTPSTTATPTTVAPPTETSTSAPPATTAPLRPGVEPIGTVSHGTIVVAGVERSYRLYVPASLPAEPAPLLLAFHGGTGWGDQFAQTDHVEQLAEANGFIVAHPDGTTIRSGQGRVWNGGVCCGIAARQDVDDVGFVAALVDQLEAQYSIDPTRVSAFGHSNGAIMSYRLGCELADRITAIGVVAGTLGVEPCTPARPVSILHLHGDADRNVPIDGGVGEDGISKVDFPSPRTGFATFAAVNGCPSTGTTSTAGALTTLVLGPCSDGVEAEFVTIAGAPHAWPGGTPLRAPGAGEAPSDYDATAAVVGFLLTHPRS